MRKLGLLVTLMVASVFMLGAAPGVASAACAVSTGTVYRPVATHNVDIAWNIHGCVGVDIIRFLGSDYGTGITDLSLGGFHGTTARGFTQYADACTGGLCWLEVDYGWQPDASAQAWDHLWCWYAGTVHTLRNELRWQWRQRSLPHTWSSIQVSIMPGYAFAC